jgi:hypothetical protein
VVTGPLPAGMSEAPPARYELGAKIFPSSTTRFQPIVGAGLSETRVETRSKRPSCGAPPSASS